MGTISCSNWNKKNDVISEVRHDLSKNFDILKDKSTSSGYWVAIENRSTKERYIYFALIKRYGKELTLKTMDESMGPCYYDCPVSFFDLVPVSETGYAKEWRESVLKRSEVKKAVKNKPAAILEKGMRFNLYGNTFTAQYQDQKNQWIVLKQDTQQLYKLKRKQLKELELL